MKRSRMVPIALLGAVVLVSACTTRTTTDAVGTFSSALNTTTAALQASVLEADRLDVALNDARLADAFVNFPLEKSPLDETEQTALEQLKTFSVEPSNFDATFKPRLEALNAMSSYANALAGLVSDEPIEKVNAQFTTAGRSFFNFASALKSALDTAQGQQNPPFATLDISENLSKATGEIAGLIVEERLNRELPPIIERTHETLVRTVELMKQDLENEDGRGLKTIIDRQIENLRLLDWRSLVRLKSAQDRVSPQELHDEYIETLNDIRRLQASKDVIERMPAALDSLVAAHAAMKSPESETFYEKITVFAERAKELKESIDRIRG